MDIFHRLTQKFFIEGTNVKFRAPWGWNFEKIVFLGAAKRCIFQRLGFSEGKILKKRYFKPQKMYFLEIGFQILTRAKHEIPSAAKAKFWKKMVFLSSKTWNYEVLQRKWWIFSDLAIKFCVNLSWGGRGHSPLSTPESAPLIQVDKFLVKYKEFLSRLRSYTFFSMKW